MKRHKTRVVTPPKQKGVDMTLHISADDQLKWARAARRQEDIERGTFVRGGVHGGDHQTRNRRERRAARRDCRDHERGGAEE